MLNLAAINLLVLQAVAAIDTTSDPSPLYVAVLQDLRAKPPVSSGVPIVLHRRMYDAAGPATRILPGELLRQLQADGSVEVICQEERAGAECLPPSREYVSVRFGPVIDLPDDARVKIAPQKRSSGVSEQQALAMVADSMAAPVDAAVDVVIHTPCPDAPASSRCRVPGIDVYRYFLRAGPGRVYQIVTRWLVGGA